MAWLGLAGLCLRGVSAAEFPDWAYPVNPPLGVFDAHQPRHAPGSTRQFTQAQIEDDFAPPDWFPQDHPVMPEVVAVGVRPLVKACSKCHLPTGGGHPESSDLAGLPASYIISQIADFKSGARKGNRSTSMRPIAGAVSGSDLQLAAAYYASLKPLYGRTRIVEADQVPRTKLGTGGMRFALKDGSTEPIGSRIIVVPADPALAEIRDWRPGFTAYVPRGSVERGKRLVATGGRSGIPCATCHGELLDGKDNVPRLAGREPLYLFRQLNDFKAGTRAGPLAPLMQPVVAGLEMDDMIAVVAYLATRDPK